MREKCFSPAPCGVIQPEPIYFLSAEAEVTALATSKTLYMMNKRVFICLQYAFPPLDAP